MSSMASSFCSFWRRSSASSTKSGVRRVAIVGAGPIGVAAAKFLVGEEAFDKIDVYEQQSSFGGVWIWSQPGEDEKVPVPQTNPYGALDKVRLNQKGDVRPPIVTTPMYDGLETNIPHILMNFSEKSFPSDALLFPKRDTVLKYIEEYSQEIKHLVKFGAQVVSLKLGQKSDGSDLWTLASKDVRTGQVREEKYDAVALANGHFSHIRIPDIAGIGEWNAAFPGSIMHSKYYRKPEDFAGKKVVIVGNASSGIDIGSQIAGKCSKPLVMSARSDPLFKMPAYAEHINVPHPVEFVNPKLGNRAVKFADGTVEENVDVVLFCTGYFMSFPFLEPSILSEIIGTGYMVHGAYQHMFWIPHPSLAFLGIPDKVLPMPLGEAQASALARVWSGRLPLPSRPQMQVWEHERWRQTADMLKAKGKPAEATHVEKAFLTMGAGQDMAYHNEIIRWAATAKAGAGRELPHIWDDREIWIRSQMAPMKKTYAELGDRKHEVHTIEDIGIDYEKHKAEQETQ